MQRMLDLLKERNLTIASVESLTAGLFASKLAEVPGASAILKGGLITYQTSCKIDVLKIESAMVQQYGVISEEVAYAMAKKGAELFKTDLVVSFTGNAGPEVMDEKPAGLVYMALFYKGNILTFKMIFSGSRNEVRESAVTYMCNKIIDLLME